MYIVHSTQLFFSSLFSDILKPYFSLLRIISWHSVACRWGCILTSQGIGNFFCATSSTQHAISAFNERLSAMSLPVVYTETERTTAYKYNVHTRPAAPVQHLYLPVVQSILGASVAF